MDYSFDYYSTIQTVVLVATFFIAAKQIKISIDITNKSIESQKLISKQNKTIELLINDLEDKTLTEGLETLNQVINKPNYPIDDLARKKGKKTPDAIAIRGLLNYYEIISVGVQSGIYDLEMIKKSQKTMIIRIFEESKSFVSASRNEDNNDNLWIEFEKLVALLKKPL